MVISKEWDQLLDVISDGVKITDHEGTIIKINPAYERFIKRTKGKLVGRNIRDMVQEGLIPVSSTLKVLETKQSVTLFHENHEMEVIYTGTAVGIKGCSV